MQLKKYCKKIESKTPKTIIQKKKEAKRQEKFKKKIVGKNCAKYKFTKNFNIKVKCKKKSLEKFLKQFKEKSAGEKCTKISKLQKNNCEKKLLEIKISWKNFYKK